MYYKLYYLTCYIKIMQHRTQVDIYLNLIIVEIREKRDQMNTSNKNRAIIHLI